MKNLYSFSIQRAFLTALLFAISIFGYGQTILQYPLKNDLNYNIGPGTTNPTIGYFDSGLNSKTPEFVAVFGGWLKYQDSGDNLLLNFDATNYTDLSVEVDFGLWAVLASSKMEVFMKIGSAPEQSLGTRNLTTLFVPISTIFSAPLTGSDNQSNIRIRIRITDGGLLPLTGISNLKIVSKTTSIAVRRDSNGYPSIPHQANASVTYDTDFGELLTNPGGNSITKTYRITNTGSNTLTIKSIQLSDPNQGFSISNAPTTINAGSYKTFNVTFAPTEQGLKMADVIIDGNIKPNNPFQFQVIGRGKSCNTSSVPIVTQHFETNNETLSFIVVSGTPGSIAGNSQSNNPQLYPGQRQLFVSPPSNGHSLYLNGNKTTVLEFGPVDITDQQEVNINFNIAAFSTSNNNYGVNSSDYIILSVQDPASPGNYIDEVRLNGSDSNTYRRYGYGDGTTNTQTMNGSLKTIANGNGSTSRYTGIVLKIPPSYASNSLKFRITIHTARNQGYWLIDNVNVNSGNAIYKTWTGIRWEDNNGNSSSSPGEREKAIFTGDYNFSDSPNSELHICECEVNDNVNFSIPAGKTLRVRNRVINLDTDDDGTNFVIDNDGFLIQTEDGAVNTGDITVNKTFTFSNVPTGQLQFNFLSSPVKDQNLKTIYTPNASGLAQYYNESNDYFYNSTGAYITGRGLAVQEPVGSSTTAKFVGVPFNGRADINLTRNRNGYNLIGNPYPSNIDLEAIYEVNQSLIQPTFYFWDNIGNSEWEQQGSNYNGSSYALYNAVAGLGVGSGSRIQPQNNSKIPNEFVTKGTGFMVQAKKAGTLSLINSYRSFKLGTDFAGKGNFNPEADDRYWLTLTSPTDFQTMMAVTYIPNGNDEFWIDDSETLGPSDDLYSIVDEHQLAIQGKKPFNQNDEVPLGYRAFHTGTQIISVHIKEGVFENGQDIYLIDHLLNKEWNLSERSYKFVSRAGEYNDRFTIVYRPSNFAPTFTKAPQNVIDFEKKDHQIVVTSSIDKIRDIEIFDLNSRSVYKKTNINANSFGVDAQSFGNQIIVVSVITETGEYVSKKFVNN